MTPYGPGTSRVRRFLVRLAALSQRERDEVVTRFAAVAVTPAYAAADVALAEAVERSERTDARDALAGPLMQIVRRRPRIPGMATPELPDAPDALDDLDPVAEPALSALLALLVEDVLPAEHHALLYAAFEHHIPRSQLTG